MITKEQLLADAKRYRCAIEEACAHNEFEHSDRMYNFPHGCCDDTADLFCEYIHRKYGIISMRVDAEYEADSTWDIQSHSWSVVDGYIIDLTGDQFRYNRLMLNYDYPVYVGEMDDFHALFKKIPMYFESRGIESLGEACWDRLYGLYDKIEGYLG